MKILWQRRYPVELIMCDAAGEYYESFVFKNEGDNYIAKLLERILLRCRSIMVTISCEDIRRERSGVRDDRDHDRRMGRLFRAILQEKNCLRQVIVLLVGADLYADSTPDADTQAQRDFDAQYRVFAGVVKNAGIPLEVVPISNIGLGNTWDKLRDGIAPIHITCSNRCVDLCRCTCRGGGDCFDSRSNRPDVHELPSRIIQLKADTTQSPPNATDYPHRAEIPDTTSNVPCGSVFISYRPNGGSETSTPDSEGIGEPPGWKVFSGRGQPPLKLFR